MTEQEKIEVSVVRTMLRIMRYDCCLAKATCKEVANYVLADRKMTDEQAEEISEYMKVWGA